MHRLLKSGRWLGFAVGIGAAAASTAIVVHCSGPGGRSSNSSLDEGFPRWDYNWDRREPYSLLKPPKKTKRDAGDGPRTSEDDGALIPDQLEKLKTKASRHIILIRHGQYNTDGRTDADKYLTPLGRNQAELTGIRLKNSGITFTSFIVSNMTRALETAHIIKKNLDQKGLEISCEDPILREGAPFLPDPPSSHYTPDLHQYYKDGARIEAAFRKYFHRAEPEQEEDSYEIVVCHANVIRYFTCRAMQFPPQAWLRISLNHTSLTMLSILPSGRVVLRALGDSGHLPANKMTTSKTGSRCKA